MIDLAKTSVRRKLGAIPRPLAGLAILITFPVWYPIVVAYLACYCVGVMALGTREKAA